MKPLHTFAGAPVFRRGALAVAISVAVATVPAYGQEDASSPPGFPEELDWAFTFDATLGVFGFADSLYTNPKPEQPSGDLGDNWTEASAKGAISAAYTMDNASQLYGAISGVGERTGGSAPTLVGDDASSFGIEDLYLGWRSGTSLGNLGEDALDFTIGRAQYNLGHGMLLWDGAAEGGTRGGYWTNARKAFEFAAIGRFKPGPHTLEAFFLDKDDLPEADSDTEVRGMNYEYTFGEDTTLGLSYLKLSANPEEAPQRDGLDVYNLRLFAAPLPRTEALSFEAEYALEDNGAALDSTAWNALVGYQFDDGPTVSYRYAFFEGDDPETEDNEAFDALLPGFYDWGTWWQGEIAGEYFVANSNLISHLLRVHMEPNEAISTGIMLWDFIADQPGSYGPLVTSDDIAFELDWYMDWSVNDNFTLSVVAAVAEPGDAIEQSSGRTDTFVYGMVFLAYSF